jgi:hypothetical protein
MARRSLQWPKLIGCILGLEALGIFMCQARLLFWSPEDSGWPSAWNTYSWLLFATFLLLLGYFVYRAHNWARRTVIGLCLCLGAVVVYGFVAAEVDWAQSPARLSLRIERALDHSGLYLSFFALLVFVIGVLCHRDVAATFRPSITERSNQTMQRTPTRGSAHISHE